MPTPDLIIKSVAAALKVKARAGKTTKREVVGLVMRKLETAPGKFSHATMMMALQALIDGEVSRQFKMGLTEHEARFRMPAATPSEIVAALGKIPRWTAISDGTDAVWVPSLQATPEHWFANASLKEKKAMQTQAKANASVDIGRFLAMNKFASLAEAMAKGV
jgi:hypothetical protein